ncbi:MAG: glycosyltransferase [Chloroflexi bacterium]|nr:glycosyltransferase [Chloroflexota bacterium]
MTENLARAGLEVHVVTTDDNGAGRAAVPLDGPVTEAGVVRRYLPRQTRFYTFSWPLTWWLAGHISGYDLVHIHALFSYPSTPAALYARRHGVPYIVRPLGTLNRWGFHHRRPWLKRLSFHLLERRILAGAAAVHFTSEQELAEARELGVPFRPAVIPLGIDAEPFTHLPSPDAFYRAHPCLAGRPITLFLSRFHAKKGLDLLLPAFARLLALQPDAALVLAGDGEPAFVDQLRAECVRLGIADSVVWTGFLRGADKLAAMAAADVFALPSYSENFGIAAVEAMAAGLPVVVSDQVAVSREIADCGAGLVVPCETESLTAALISLHHDADLRERLSRTGRRLVQDRFSLGATTRRLVSLYSQIVDRQDARV